MPFATDLRIDPLMDLSIANITTTGNINASSATVGNMTCNSLKSPSTASGVEIRSVGDALLTKVFDSGQTQLYNSLDVNTNVTIGGKSDTDGLSCSKAFCESSNYNGGWHAIDGDCYRDS